MAALLAVLLAVVACGGEDPAELAREACKASPPGDGVPAAESSEQVTPDELDRLLRELDSAADLAAQAAAEDRRWETLATAYSNSATLFAQARPIMESQRTGSEPDEQRQQGQVLLQSITDALATVRAQCRIADASK